MAKRISPLLPATAHRLVEFGARLRLARLRRRLTAKQVAERAGMTPVTLRHLERGGSGVTMGAYLAVMQVLGVEHDLDQIAKTDPQGRDLQDAHLSTRAKAAGAPTLRPEASPRLANANPPRPASVSDGPDAAWIADGDFISANTLAGLLTPAPTPRARNRSAKK